MFTQEYVLNSDWYNERLRRKQEYDLAHWQKNRTYFTNIISNTTNLTPEKLESLKQDLKEIEQRIEYYQSPKYLESLIGTIGKDLLYRN
jgi:hypothetical protein